MVSALQRLVREGKLEGAAAQQAETVGARILERAHCIIDVEGAKRIATRLLRVHELRAGDALQLAAAVLLSDGAPSAWWCVRSIDGWRTPPCAGLLLDPAAR